MCGSRSARLLLIFRCLAVLGVGLAINPAQVFAQTGPDSRQISNQPASVVGAPERYESLPADQTPVSASSASDPGILDLENAVSPERVSSTLQLLLSMTVLSLAPSILMMTTSFVRFVVIFGLLRQALGIQQMPPNQVMVGLSLFMTLLVMSPVWQKSYDEGIRPYTDPRPGELRPSLKSATERTVGPVRTFMANQIERAGNSNAVWTFLQYQRPDPETTAGREYREPETYDELPLSVLLPAFMVSELKTAFLIGFQLYLPFLVIDMVVSSVLISMGMMMLPPVLVSLPFKLLLFVLIDGWNLTVEMMLNSVATGL